MNLGRLPLKTGSSPKSVKVLKWMEDLEIARYGLLRRGGDWVTVHRDQEVGIRFSTAPAFPPAPWRGRLAQRGGPCRGAGGQALELPVGCALHTPLCAEEP